MEFFIIGMSKSWKLKEVLENFGTILENFGKVLENFGKILGKFWKILGKFWNKFSNFGKFRIVISKVGVKL